MRIVKLAAAAAIAISALGLTAAPADAQRGDRWHHDRGRHAGWDRGRHHGWRNNHRRHRVCGWTWRHHHRVRTCRWSRW